MYIRLPSQDPPVHGTHEPDLGSHIQDQSNSLQTVSSLKQKQFL